MTELYIFSQDDDLLTIITEDTGLVSAPVRIEVNSVPDTPFSFTVEADAENAKYVKEENKAVYRDHEGDLRLVVIRELDDSDSLEGPLTTATCEPEFMELAETFVLDRRFTDRTAQFALDAALENTGWIGEVEVELGLASTNFYRLRVVDAIFDILETWGGEFKDVVEFDEENNIIARKLKIIQRLGADTGQRFEIDHNITEISRTVLSYPVTAMYGWGASLETEGGGHTRYIDFADVEWKKGVNRAPVDKPKGQKWVGDPEAFERYKRYRGGKWVHRYGEFSNQDYEDPEELLWATWQNLQENKQPEVNYRLSVDLFDDKVSLGDTAIAIDRYFSRPIEIQTRIIAMEYDLLDIEGTMIVEMGQFLNLHDDRLDKLEEKVDKVASRPQKVTENSYPDRKPSTPVNLEAYGGFETIQLYWDYADEIFIKHYEVYGSQVADFVPDEQHLLWRGQVSAFGHAVNTDETWYYYVRAVNYHGTASDWSVKVSASTVRIISEDILWGPELAERMRELHHVSDIIGENGVNFDQISQEAKDLINQQARIYTDEEIRSTREDLMRDISDISENLEYIDGQLVDKVNVGDVYEKLEIDNMFENTVSITQYETDMSGVVKNLEHQESLIKQNEKEILNRVNETIFHEESNYLRKSIAETRTFAEGIEQTVSSIEIGGRNLALNTKADWTNGTVGQWGLSGLLRVPIDGITLKHGSTVTFSVYVKDIPKGESVYPRLDWYKEDGTYSSSTDTTFRVTNEGRMWLTAPIPEDTSFTEVRARIMPVGWTGNYQIKYKQEQLEKGNKATDWHPAFEDIDSRMSLSESQIAQLSDDITLKVNVDEIVSEININREGIRLSSELIHLSGLSLIEDAIIENVHIKNGTIERSKLVRAIIGEAQIEDLAVTSAKIHSVNADKINATNLQAISGNMGTLRSGRLLSNNNNMDLNLNTGNLTMRNADFTLGGGANIGFTSAGNRIYYERVDGSTTRTSGIGVGNAYNSRFPVVWVGTTGTSRLNFDPTDENYFTGFIANTSQRQASDGIQNSVVGHKFHIRDQAVAYNKGFEFDLNGSTITMRPMSSGSYNYYIGMEDAIFTRVYTRSLRAPGAVEFRPTVTSNRGWELETGYSGDGGGIALRGFSTGSFNYVLGKRNARLTNIFLKNNPDVDSDRRLKEQIAPLVSGLEIIKELNPVSYRLKLTDADINQGITSNDVQYGFIAQDVVQALEKFNFDTTDMSLVKQGDDGMYSMSYTELIPFNTRAIQELDKKLEEEINWQRVEYQILNNKVTKINNEIAQLRKEHKEMKEEIKELREMVA